MSDTSLDDVQLFIDEEEDIHTKIPEARFWQVLIVDDDDDVHRATEFALSDVTILNRKLKFIHTFSKQESLQVMRQSSNIAVILLDVVMETERAGLELVSLIRNELNWQDTRIILRTGQPGYAPEEEAIRDYDINDYKTKNELTRKKLLTALTSAIRSYDQICKIEHNRRGLHQIINANASVSVEHGMQIFASTIIEQISAICGIPPEGLLLAQSDQINHLGHSQSFSVIAATGQYHQWNNCLAEEIGHTAVGGKLKQALTHRQSSFGKDNMTLFFTGQGNRPLAAFIELPYALSEIDQQLLEVFCSNIGVSLDNLGLVNQLRNYAYRDQLLMLPNRLKFIEQIDLILNSSNRQQMLVLIDIDDFASINDVLGHHYADLLLQAIADRLQQKLGQEIFLARISGDVFGLLGAESLLQAGLLNELFNISFLIENTEHSASISMGMVALKEYEHAGIDALKDASIALKRTKGMQRGSSTLFTREMGVEIRERAQLMQHLHKAFAADRLFLAYQPQVDLKTGRLIGLETLLRWRNESGKLIPPSSFIPLAEHSGLIVTLGAWVLRTACHTMVGLQKAGLAPDRMAVNVSVMQFRQIDFVDVLKQALFDSGLKPQYLELEITESLTMMGAGVLEESLAQIKAMGVQIAIDDFGTGFSSLSYLDQLPVDRLKIDIAFVRQIDAIEGPRIAELIAQLAKRLKLGLIAEGIETEYHWNILRDMGCEEGQGFFIAQAMPEAELKPWILHWNQRLQQKKSVMDLADVS